jgi:hypothetical protein
MMAAILTGCAVKGPDFEKKAVAAAKSAIYVYRQYSAYGAGAPLTVNCGDNSVTLGPGGYHEFTVEPGDELCSSSSENSASVQIAASAGQAYYVKGWISIGFFLPHVHLQTVEPNLATLEIAQCKRQ